jgi:hypothetical protein
MMPTFAVVVDPRAAGLEHIQCGICLEPWADPVELRPCEHIYCRTCVARLVSCPTCRRSVQEFRVPNRTLCNIAADVVVRCEGCARTGTRDASNHHVCEGSPSSAGTKRARDEPCTAPARPPQPALFLEHAPQHALSRPRLPLDTVPAPATEQGREERPQPGFDAPFFFAPRRARGRPRMRQLTTEQGREERPQPGFDAPFFFAPRRARGRPRMRQLTTEQGREERPQPRAS